jgi:hypothetical protein
MVMLPNGVKAWGQGCFHYIHNAVANLGKWMKNTGYKLPKIVSTPTATTYHPEPDVSSDLDPDSAN